ncbi:flagellin [Tateyamaria omphalii]|uniref:flagellin n=1 Tax=Tateyamaria omphalii TaxID=299262 RepID=UPI001675FF3A|nr:flagellin [Tateyamaria omphalii]GGX38464.1 flagellin [Tateyamaria omphalii]
MSSILTNNSAMVALQTLKGINKNLAMTQNEISTGKSVSSAKDNSAVWAISKVMESDVAGFKAVSESLSLGESTVATAANAAESITDLLNQMKGRIVAAQEENVDRGAIQQDIESLTEQIGSVVSAAQFNGLNLIDGTSTDDVQILSSLNRDNSGAVTAGQIDVVRQNLSTTTPATAQSFGTGVSTQPLANAAVQVGAANTGFAAAATDPVSSETVAGGGSVTVSFGAVSAGNSYQLTLDGLSINTADGSSATGRRDFQFVASAEDGQADVINGLANQLSAFFDAATDGADGYSVNVDVDAGTLTFSTGATAGDVDVGAVFQNGGTAGSTASSGGLGALATLDVTSDSGAASALTAIDGLIGQSISAAAAFGTVQNRIETQSDFVSSLTDSFKSGIGSLVDADMEEVSARLQALQTQQQLGVQSLSIANQAPQSILSLFR